LVEEPRTMERALVNPFSPEAIEDPQRAHAFLLERGPVFCAPLGAWLVGRYAEVSACLKDARLSSRTEGQGAPQYEGFPADVRAQLSALFQSVGRWMLFLDGAPHARY